MSFESFFRCKLGNTINTAVHSIYKLGQFLKISTSQIFLQVFVNNVFERSNIPLSDCGLGFVFGCIILNLTLFTKFFEFTFKLGFLVCPNPFWFFLLGHFLNASTASFAYEAFIGWTRKYRNKTPTATSKNLSLFLCWATLSIHATSTDQISLILGATAFSLGKDLLTS